MFKVGADIEDVKRTGCPAADWPDKGEGRLCKLVQVNRQLIVQGTVRDTNIN